MSRLWCCSGLVSGLIICQNRAPNLRTVFEKRRNRPLSASVQNTVGNVYDDLITLLKNMGSVYKISQIFNFVAIRKKKRFPGGARFLFIFFPRLLGCYGVSVASSLLAASDVNAGKGSWDLGFAEVIRC